MSAEAVRFATKLLAFAPSLILVASVNYIADPSSVFHPGRDGAVAARLLLDGQNVAVPSVGEELRSVR